ncbi:hypothetical protein AAHN97_16010 [Chitinophaga niabensis]|uniref:hypothetical protein n=1 Tax=Chitinophaga niabensis TaxID=536979 RepID=UPI0031BAB340
MTEKILSFQEVIDELVPGKITPKDMLPFCHTTTIGCMASILKTKFAEPRSCDVYQGEKLLYFFYGKASYEVEKVNQYTDNPPFTLIYDCGTIGEDISRIVAFDSGGFPLLKARAGFDKEHYTYSPGNIYKLMAYIKLMYEDHVNYLGNEINLKKLEAYKDRCLEIEEMLRIYTEVSAGRLPVDERVYSIELQLQRHVSFNPKYLVIAYDQYILPFWGKNFTSAHPEIKVITYGQAESEANKFRSLKAGIYQELMYQKVKSIIENNIPR